jgi:predicted outer membrane lipoprotein
MKTNFVRLLGIILACALPSQVVRADVAPPVEPAVVATGGVIGLCLVVLVIAAASFFVIRAIKKSHTPKDGA